MGSLAGAIRFQTMSKEDASVLRRRLTNVNPSLSASSSHVRVSIEIKRNILLNPFVVTIC